MKENLELVEKLVEKTGLSYTEAKAALEKADWDILEAIINLEADGKVGGVGAYSTRAAEGGNTAQEETKGNSEKGNKKKSSNEEFKKNATGFLEWLRSVFDKGNSNNLELYKDGNRILGMPVTVFLLLCLISVGTVIVLMIVSLFFGFRYRFAGPDLGKDKINDAMGKATDYADNIKQEIKNNTQKND